MAMREIGPDLADINIGSKDTKVLLRVEWADGKVEFIECEDWTLKTDGCLHIMDTMNPQSSKCVKQIIPLYSVRRITPTIKGT